MKNLLLVLAIFPSILITGCREDLTISTDSGTADKSVHLNYETIEICCQVYDPSSGPCGVTGCVNYHHQIINNPDDTGIYTIHLNLDINVELCSMCMMLHPEWKVKDFSDDKVTVSKEGITLIEKIYAISNREEIKKPEHLLWLRNTLG